MTPDEARRIAKQWAARVAQGEDPAGARQVERDAPIMGDLCDRYLAEHAAVHKKPGSATEDRRMIEAYIRPAFGRRKVAEIARADVLGLHRKLAEKPYQANRVLALASKMFNLAELWGLRPDGSNPCRHVKRYREDRRERFLSEAEIAALGRALAAAERGEVTTSRGGPVPWQAVAAIRLMIFTGARKSEILTLRWAWIDAAAGRAELPDSKTGRRLFYLPPPALELLRALPRVPGNPHVIPGRKPGAPMVNIAQSWEGVRAAAKLPDLRLHDLRHSFASVGAGAGMSLPLIGALLGHRETATTARYAHLSDDPQRSAAALIGGRIALAMAGKEGAEGRDVVSLAAAQSAGGRGSASDIGARRSANRRRLGRTEAKDE